MAACGVDTPALADDAAPRGRGRPAPRCTSPSTAPWPAWSTVADTVKPDAAEAVAQLKALGLQVWMVTGDNAATARRRRRRQVGIDHVIAEVLPADKADARRRAAGRRARRRDGRRRHQRRPRPGHAPTSASPSAPAPTSPSPPPTSPWSAATCAASSPPSPCRGAPCATIKQGLVWAFAYNVLLIPVAAGALYWWHGLLLDPVLASAAMAMSSVSVVTNALRLRRFRRPGDRPRDHPPAAAHPRRRLRLPGRRRRRRPRPRGRCSPGPAAPTRPSAA